MLKIAEYNKKTGKKIELKELEKYGFKQEWNYKTHLYDGSYYCSSFKICKNKHIKPYNGTNQNRYDVMFDLITDGYIEKVENEK